MRAIPLALSALVIGALLPAPAQAATASNLYVAPNGNDQAACTQAKPCKTLTGARNVARRMHTADPAARITVNLQPGTYAGQVLQLTSADSNTTWRASSSAVISGATELAKGNFVPVTDAAAKATIPAAALPKVRQYKLPTTVKTLTLHSAGYEVPGQASTGLSTLSIGGTTQKLSTFPKTGFDTVATAVRTDANGFSFIGANTAPRRWKSMADVWVSGHWGKDWADVTAPVTSFAAATGQVSTTVASPYGLAKGGYFTYINSLPTLSNPGEWAISSRGMLFVVPPAAGLNGPISLATETRPLISVSGGKNIAFQGLTLKDTLGDGVTIAGSTNVAVSGSRLQNIGGRGVSVTASTKSGISTSSIREIGHVGVYLSGGDRATLTPSGNFATDNTIVNFNTVLKSSQGGVSVAGVGNQVIRNEIAQGPQIGVYIHGNNNVISGNDIHDVMKEASDAGAIYLGRDWTEAGNVIRSNWVHKVHGYYSEIGGYWHPYGIYLDDLASGTTVQSNLVTDVSQPLMVGGGRSNVVLDNFCANAETGSQFDERGLNFAAPACGAGGILQERLAAMPVTSAKWAAAYPWLQALAGDQPCIPKGNVVKGNVSAGVPASMIDPTIVKFGTFASNPFVAGLKVDSPSAVASLLSSATAQKAVSSSSYGPKEV